MLIEAASSNPSLPALILPLVGVVIGASISAGIGLWTSRQQRLATIAAEKRNLAAVLEAEKRGIAAAREADRHGRAMIASARAADALTALLLLDRDPDAERQAELSRLLRNRKSYEAAIKDVGAADDEEISKWEERRRTLIVTVDSSSLDIDDTRIRDRLEQVVRALNLYQGPEKNIRQSEYRTRHLAVSDGLACLGAFRRGDELPALSEEFKTTIEFVDLYLEELEQNSRR